MRPHAFRLSTTCLLLLALLGIAASARATTVIPPSFDELISRADTVFTGDVLGVRAGWEGEGADRRIVSFVSFDVVRLMKGQAGTPYTLRMLGGTVGTRTLEVADAPRFVTGDRVILFVKDNGKQFFPTVGIMYGVYRLERPGTTTANAAAPAEIVLDHTGRKLASVEEIGKDAATRETMRHAVSGGDGAATNAGLTREQFETRIIERVQALGGPQP